MSTESLALTKYMDKFHWRPSDPTEACVRFAGSETGSLLEGKPYEDFLCLYPWLKPFYMEWEINYRPHNLFYFLLDNHWIPITSVILYAIMVAYGPKYMKDRKPWGLKTSLTLWNLLLSVFSLIGFIRVGTTLIHITSHYTFRENLCYDPHIHSGNNEGGNWIVFFSLSKIAELVDTFFIIVNKKPLILLHWYHHLSVLLYCWFFLLYTAPAGIYFCVLNYGVHAIMYFYYFLMSAKMKPKWMNPKIITVMQIVQMIIGMSVTVLGVYYNYIGIPDCYTSYINAVPTFVMYGSYFVLFAKFYYDRYIAGGNKKKTSTDKKSS